MGRIGRSNRGENEGSKWEGFEVLKKEWDWGS